MGNAVAFDTHAYVKKLREAGVDERQAEIQAEALVSLVEDRLATKRDVTDLQRDLAEIEAGLKRDIEALRFELKRDLQSLDAKVEISKSELKRDIDVTRADLKRDIAESRADTIRWIITLSLAQLGVLTGILFAVFRIIPPHP